MEALAPNGRSCKPWEFVAGSSNPWEFAGGPLIVTHIAFSGVLLLRVLRRTFDPGGLVVSLSCCDLWAGPAKGLVDFLSRVQASTRALDEVEEEVCFRIPTLIEVIHDVDSVAVLLRSLHVLSDQEEQSVMRCTAG